MSAQQVLDQGSTAPIGHGHHGCTQRLAHQQACKLRHAAHSGNAVIGLARIGFEPSAKFTRRFDTNGAGQRHHVVVTGDTGQGREVLERVIARRLEGQRNDHMRVVDGQHHCGTVRRSSLELLRGDHAASTGFVVDDNGLVHDHTQFFSHDAGHHIGGASGRESHHDADRAVVIGGMCGPWQCHEQQKK